MSVRTAGEQASEAIGHASIHHRTWLRHQSACRAHQRLLE
jgi:hypothetical protein